MLCKICELYDGLGRFEVMEKSYNNRKVGAVRNSGYIYPTRRYVISWLCGCGCSGLR